MIELEKAQRENRTYIDFLNDFLEAEVAERQKRNMEVRCFWYNENRAFRNLKNPA